MVFMVKIAKVLKIVVRLVYYPNSLKLKGHRIRKKTLIMKPSLYLYK